MTTNVKRGAGRPAAAARRTRAAQNTPLPPKVGTLPPKPEVPEGVHPKAKQFADVAAANGWTVDVKHVKSTKTDTVVATRGNERLHITWTDGTYQRWAGYTVGDSTEKRVPNAKSGQRILESAEGTVAAPKAAPKTAPKTRAKAAVSACTDSLPSQRVVKANVYHERFNYGVRGSGVLSNGLNKSTAIRLQQFFAKDGIDVEVFES